MKSFFYLFLLLGLLTTPPVLAKVWTGPQSFERSVTVRAVDGGKARRLNVLGEAFHLSTLGALQKCQGSHGRSSKSRPLCLIERRYGEFLGSDKGVAHLKMRSFLGGRALKIFKKESRYKSTNNLGGRQGFSDFMELMRECKTQFRYCPVKTYDYQRTRSQGDLLNSLHIEIHGFEPIGS